MMLRVTRRGIPSGWKSRGFCDEADIVLSFFPPFFLAF